MEYLLLVVGFVLLIKGADFFVEGSSDVARLFKIPSVVIGLTIVAAGTSAPEAAVSITAGLAGSNDIALNNVIGSNMFNLLVVVGMCAAIKVFVADEIIFKRDLPICIGLTALLTVFLFDGALNWVDGLILLVLFVAYIAMTVVVALKGRDKNQPEEETKKQRKWWLSLIFIAGGLAGVIFGGDLVVDSASKIALNLGMSEALVGLTIVALGTSLPELVTSITAARKGDSGMALGNVVGSNIFNLLLILGSSSVLSPIGTNQNTMVDILFCLGVTIFTFVAIALCKKKVNRPVGIAMVLLYIAYMIFAILR
ncbi:MAG: calcium/sodium antiporter [Clostridia bacterium]|nr:calcium/sodium antiporter [Clostridia bacterium]